MSRIIGYDGEGNPIYGAEFDDMGTAISPTTTKKETGKSFNDAIKDLFWDVLGREPRPEELSAYKTDFGAKIDSDEEQIFFDRPNPSGFSGELSIFITPA